jgi:hypothetical protein
VSLIRSCDNSGATDGRVSQEASCGRDLGVAPRYCSLVCGSWSARDARQPRSATALVRSGPAIVVLHSRWRPLVGQGSPLGVFDARHLHGFAWGCRRRRWPVASGPGCDDRPAVGPAGASQPPGTTTGLNDHVAVLTRGFRFAPPELRLKKSLKPMIAAGNDRLIACGVTIRGASVGRSNSLPGGWCRWCVVGSAV